MAQFEKSFAAFLGTQFTVGVANGTDSLVMSYQALGIGPGDEVISRHTPLWLRLSGPSTLAQDLY